MKIKKRPFEFTLMHYVSVHNLHLSEVSTISGLMEWLSIDPSIVCSLTVHLCDPSISRLRIKNWLDFMSIPLFVLLAALLSYEFWNKFCITKGKSPNQYKPMPYVLFPFVLFCFHHVKYIQSSVNGCHFNKKCFWRYGLHLKEQHIFVLHV